MQSDSNWVSSLPTWLLITGLIGGLITIATFVWKVAVTIGTHIADWWRRRRDDGLFAYMKAEAIKNKAPNTLFSPGAIAAARRQKDQDVWATLHRLEERHKVTRYDQNRPSGGGGLWGLHEVEMAALSRQMQG